jgi:hypothetical protein
MSEKEEGVTDLSKTALEKMFVGEMIEYKKGSHIEIHRVIGGWIHVFQLCNSQLVTEFVPEELNVRVSGPSRRNIGPF